MTTLVRGSDGQAFAEDSSLARDRRTRGLKLGALLVVLFLLTLLFTAKLSVFDIYSYNLWMLSAIGALALSLLTGTGGQLSVGNSAFLLVGGYGSVILAQEAGLAFPLDVLLATVAAALVGLIVGLPAVRFRGLYLALTTLAAFFILTYLAGVYQSRGPGAAGFRIDVVAPTGLLDEQIWWAWRLTLVLAVCVLITGALRSGKTGRALRLIREHEVIAPTMGIPVAGYKLALFSVTSGLIGLQGGLTAYFTGLVTIETFTLALAISYLGMIFIGGADTLVGPLVGAALIGLLSFYLPIAVENVGASPSRAGQLSQVIYGTLIVLFITRARGGIVGWLNDLAAAVLGRWRPRRG